MQTTIVQPNLFHQNANGSSGIVFNISSTVEVSESLDEKPSVWGMRGRKSVWHHHTLRWTICVKNLILHRKWTGKKESMMQHFFCWKPTNRTLRPLKLLPAHYFGFKLAGNETKRYCLLSRGCDLWEWSPPGPTQKETWSFCVCWLDAHFCMLLCSH